MCYLNTEYSISQKFLIDQIKMVKYNKLNIYSWSRQTLFNKTSNKISNKILFKKKHSFYNIQWDLKKSIKFHI